MKKFYVTIVSLLMFFGWNITAEAKVLMTSSEYFGNAMSGGTAKSGEIKYFYDANGKIVSKYENKGTEPFQRTEYTYNAQGHLVSETLYQWGLFDDGADGWNDGDVTTYTVDANGNRTSVIVLDPVPWDPSFKYTKFKYKYDAQGNLIQEEEYESFHGVASTTPITIIQYSDFSAGKNKPAKKVVSAPGHDNPNSYDYWNGSNYTATMTYDAQGNKLTEYEVRKDGDYGDRYEWKYEDGFLVKYTKYKWVYDGMGDYNDGDFYTSVETRYEPVNGNKMVVRHSDWSAMPWYDGDQVSDTELTQNLGSLTIDKYVDFTGQAEYFACELSAEISDVNTNTVKLTATLPEAAQFGTVRYDVYRNSQLVSTHLISDLAAEGNVDPENNEVFIYDANLKNGKYRYFVQIVKLADEEDVENPNAEWIGYNVSNVATITAELVNLPVATNIRMQTCNKGNGSNGTATVAYDFPSTIDPAFGFQGNYLFIKTLGTFRLTPDSSTSNAGNGTLTADLIASETIDVYIQSRYKYGKVKSEVVTLNMDTATSIDIMSEDAKDAVFFNLDGRQVENVNLHGTYIMIKDGKISKINIK